MIDIGVNLNSPALAPDLSELLDRARRGGVRGFLSTGTTVEGSIAGRDLAEQHPDIWFTAGVHPHHAQRWTASTPTALARLMSHPRCRAGGECGLDYARMLSPRELQLTAFEAQLQLAQDHRLPLFLHCRESHTDFIAVLQGCTGLRGVVHCFTGGPLEALRYLEMGLDIGVTGWVTDDRRAADLRCALRVVPLERLHVETDAPYLPPTNRPGARRRDRNEPAHLPWVVQAVADAGGWTSQAVAAQTTLNSRRLFGLEPIPS